MNITRNSILDSILGRGVFPTCRVKRIGDEIHIYLRNSKGVEIYDFVGDVKELPKERSTYYEIYEFLLNNPLIRLEDIKEKKIIL